MSFQKKKKKNQEMRKNKEPTKPTVYIGQITTFK